MTQPSNESLFDELYNAQTETEVDAVIQRHPEIFTAENWHPLGRNQNNYGVIENQQSSPIAALIEKVTNSIDATLLKKCKQAGIDPKSLDAPRSMDEAIARFYPTEYKTWDKPSFRNKQAEEIQILADGPRFNTSLIIYDNGEGQHPDALEDTFLSLLNGNKKEIMFVQGTYNMGGSGAIVFCGKKHYQLLGSRKFDETGEFGFTLIREHPLSKQEEKTRKNTWYEYLKLGGKIPTFAITEKDLRLHNRKFKTGSVIKLFSYDLPEGSRSVISRDLNQSLNEYLFQPALPVLTIDRKERYPKDIHLERSLYGLKRRLEQDDGKYIEESFSEEIKDESLGIVKVVCYVFKSKVEGKTVQETKETIRREFFKSGMSVLFSINGQVHGSYSSEFITRALKLNLLKDYLLIQIDCTNIDYNFRKELFMASRDRLKNGDETAKLRKLVADRLGEKDGILSQIEQKRRDSISVDSSSTKDLIKSFTKNFEMKNDLLKLLGRSFKLDEAPPERKKEEKKQKRESTKKPFNPKRFPTFLRAKASAMDDLNAVKVPIGGEKTITFETDVEDQYFHRIEEPGDLQMSLMTFSSNSRDGLGSPDGINQADALFNVVKRSPKNGEIRITLNPKQEAKVGESAQLKVTLTSPTENYDAIFWVKLTDDKAPPEDTKKEEEVPDDKLNLPEPILVYREQRDQAITWDKVEEATGEQMGPATVMFPFANGELLERIYINMDSDVLRNFKHKKKAMDEKEIEIADKKYISAVYFHTLFLYTISKNNGFKFLREAGGKDSSVDLSTYLKTMFDGYYSEFILNFGGAGELFDMLS